MASSATNPSSPTGGRTGGSSSKSASSKSTRGKAGPALAKALPAHMHRIADGKVDLKGKWTTWTPKAGDAR